MGNSRGREITLHHTERLEPGISGFLHFIEHFGFKARTLFYPYFLLYTFIVHISDID